jgi:soluble lytic murein transglycosylase-like protein
MRLLALIACVITLAIALPALAEVRPAKPSWAERKRVELRAERDVLRRHVRNLRRTLRHKPSAQEALRLASVAYGVPLSLLHRRAFCESRFDPNARNPSGASGLLQFLPSTFHSTPYAREDIFSPYANAMAAGWMIGEAGRGGEWVCR